MDTGLTVCDFRVFSSSESGVDAGMVSSGFRILSSPESEVLQAVYSYIIMHSTHAQP